MRIYISFGEIYCILGRYYDAQYAYEKAIELSGVKAENLLEFGGGINILLHFGHAIIYRDNS